MVHNIKEHFEDDIRRTSVQDLAVIKSVESEFWNRWIRQVICYDPNCAIEKDLFGDISSSKPIPWHPLEHSDFLSFGPQIRKEVIELSSLGLRQLEAKLLQNPLALKIKKRSFRSQAVHLLVWGDASAVSRDLIEAQFSFSTTDNEWDLDITDFAKGKTLEELIFGIKRSDRGWVIAVRRLPDLSIGINYYGEIHQISLK